MTHSGATALSQSGPGSDGNEGVLHIPQSSSIIGASDCLVSYPGQSLVGSYHSAEKESAYSTSPGDRAILRIAWKQVRSVLEMSTLFNLSYGVSIHGTYLVDNLLIPTISVKTVWTEPELMPVYLAICETERCQSTKTIPCLVWIPQLISLLWHRLGSSQQVSVECPHRFPLVSDFRIVVQSLFGSHR